MDARTLRRLRKREPLIRARLAACPDLLRWPELSPAASEFLRNDPELHRLTKHLPPATRATVLGNLVRDLQHTTTRMLGNPQS